jgi:hypothetical protein
MFRVYAASVRSIYLLAVICSAAIGSWLLLQFVSPIVHPSSYERANVVDLAITILLLACVLPAARALVRLVLRRELVPDAHLRDRPVIAMLVALSAALGLLLVYLLLRVWIDVLPWGTDAGGPIAGAAMLAATLLAIAMLTGEIVLVGRISQPDALPGA